MSKIFVDQVDPKTATTLTLGTTGDTVSIPTGVTLSGSGTITPSAVNIAASGAGGVTGTLPIANGGTGATTLAGAGLTNAPGFQAKLSASQNPSGSTWTTIAFNTELYDSDGCYDNSSTYAFTPTTAGKYLVYWAVTADISVVPALENIHTKLRKNGSTELINYMGNNDNNWINITSGASTVVDMNGSSDYIDIQGYISVSSGASYFYAGSYFGAYLLIGA